ncbi:hypothetical protein K435DRAFT_880309 [Dendrothele bispora CBS 962.96]|uniref:GCM domain-containing protein n=1 Tax=Dendrothele bispora (strain CBS 962.96) TaxID=1314807 RepID=A0A4S8KJT2_DENBC|nr:hypothetical protein K435DRAFT_880309 [Dendrothele bispora CBS 962.96]
MSQPHGKLPIKKTQGSIQRVPVKDLDGNIVSFQEIPTEMVQSIPVQVPASSMPVVGPSNQVTVPSQQGLAQQSHGLHPSVPQSKVQLPPEAKITTNVAHNSNPYSWKSLDLSDPAPTTKFTPLAPQLKALCRNNRDSGVLFTSLELLEGEQWTNWPSGPFAMDFNHREFEASKSLQVHWATRSGSGSNGRGHGHGSHSSSTIDGGFETFKQCLGVMTCRRSTCRIITRPKTTPAGRERQTLCQCGSKLTHRTCDSKSYLISWGEVGDDITTRKYRYINGSKHNHSQLSHIHHLGPKEQVEFDELYNRMGSNAKPSRYLNDSIGNKGLVVVGAANISPLLCSRSALAYHIRKAIAKDQNGHGFLTRFRNWMKEHEGFVRIRINTANQEVAVFSFQTDWMVGNLVKPRPEDSSSSSQLLYGPIEGLITDAAHKYWADPAALLIVTSCFDSVTDMWAPALFTYADGGTAEHYLYHFLGLFIGIEEAANAKGLPLVDEMFLMVSLFYF